MPVELREFAQPEIKRTNELNCISAIARSLLNELNTPDTLARIEAANQPKTSSAEIQAAFRQSAFNLGFESERKGLFQDSVTGLRPDYFLGVGDTGIILEVERGKTVTNNMDLLDFWKCHLCGNAHFLFLLVPKALRHNHDMSPKNTFETVSRRLSMFFEPGNYTNVRGLFLFGY